MPGDYIKSRVERERLLPMNLERKNDDQFPNGLRYWCSFDTYGVGNRYDIFALIRECRPTTKSKRGSGFSK